MGALYQGLCFGSVSDAAHSYFSAQPYVVVPGSVTYHARFKLDQGVWKRFVYQDSTLLSASIVSAPDFPECDSAALALDGMALGWLVAGCWVAAWAVMLIKRSL